MNVGGLTERKVECCWQPLSAVPQAQPHPLSASRIVTSSAGSYFASFYGRRTDVLAQMDVRVYRIGNVLNVPTQLNAYICTRFGGASRRLPMRPNVPRFLLMCMIC